MEGDFWVDSWTNFLALLGFLSRASLEGCLSRCRCFCLFDVGRRASRQALLLLFFFEVTVLIITMHAFI